MPDLPVPDIRENRLPIIGQNHRTCRARDRNASCAGRACPHIAAGRWANQAVCADRRGVGVLGVAGEAQDALDLRYQGLRDVAGVDAALGFPAGHALRAPRLVESDLGGGLPALAVLFDLSVLGELGQNPVEVVGSNTHLLGHLGNGDARLGLN
jgi:hypothetical protein